MLARRLMACRKRIHQKSIDGYLITQRFDQFYLTGFDGEDGAALILPKRVILVTDGRFKDEAARSAAWARVVIRKGTLVDALKALVHKHRIRRLGFQPEALTVRSHRSLRRALRPARLVAMPPVPEEMRIIKDGPEIAVIEKAIDIAESAFRRTVRRIRVGMTERELAAQLGHEMLRLGATEPSFPIIVAEGSNAAFPHAVPGDRRLREGSAVLIDWGATVDHYRSDLTRVIFIRRIPPRIRRMYLSVLAAQREAITAIKPGARMCDVDAVARRSLKRAGMGRQFSHGLGHGIGLDIHEAPRLSSRVKDPLQPGMVVTAEPGVYFPGIGGVRIEDDVLVTDDGCRVLTSLPTDIDEMVV